MSKPKKLLLLLKLTDRCWVLVPKEGVEEITVPNLEYKKQATGLLARLLLRHRGRCLKTEASDAIADILGFRRASDMEVLRPIRDHSTEWHPIVMRLDVYGFDSKFLNHIHAERNGFDVIPVDEHLHAEKLNKRLG